MQRKQRNRAQTQWLVKTKWHSVTYSHNSCDAHKKSEFFSVRFSFLRVWFTQNAALSQSLPTDTQHIVHEMHQHNAPWRHQPWPGRRSAGRACSARRRRRWWHWSGRQTARASRSAAASSCSPGGPCPTPSRSYCRPERSL